MSNTRTWVKRPYTVHRQESVPLDPFTSSDDVAFLGDLKPGDHATAQFQLSVDKAATKKEYGLDSEIRYRDALDATHISDTMKVKINIVNRAGIAAITSNPILVTIIIAGGHRSIVLCILLPEEKCREISADSTDWSEFHPFLNPVTGLRYYFLNV